jgi:hypothetical protein
MNPVEPLAKPQMKDIPMPRDLFLGGPNSDQPQASVADCGGCLPGDTIDVNNYKQPYGPKGIMAGNSVGLHGKNHGNANGPDNPRSPGGIVGLNGKNRKSGAQGRY